MAQIPVERTRTFPRWAWFIALLVVLVGGWLAVDAVMDDDDEQVAVAPMVDNEPEEDVAVAVAIPRDTPKLTSVSPLLDSPLAQVGRTVAIPNLHVTAVVGDAAFYVAASDDAADRSFFVWLEEVPTPNEPRIEGRYDVNVGQTLTLYGTVERLDDHTPAHWGITEAEAVKMKDDVIYLRATELNITDAALGFVEVN